MRDIRWRPSARPLLWGALAGLVASLAIGFPLHALTGALSNGIAPLAGGADLARGWGVHLLAGALFGAAYTLFVRTDDLARGAGWGLGYGLLVGTLGFWLMRALLLGRAPDGGLAAVVPIALHAGWGLLLGIGTAWAVDGAHHGRLRRRAGRPA